MAENKKEISHTRPWVFSLVLAKLLVPLTLFCVSLVMYKRMGMSNSMAAAVTAVLCLPFMLRSYYKPLLSKVRNQRWWVVLFELLFAAVMMGVAESVESKSWEWKSWLWLLLASFVGGIHSVVIDEYLCRLVEKKCTKWEKRLCGCAFGTAIAVGIGLVLMVAGDMEVLSRNLGDAWSTTFQMVAGVFVVLAVIQYALLKPLNSIDSLSDRKEGYKSFWHSEGRWTIVLTMLIFPMHEWMVLRGASLFMVDVGSIGGLSLGPQEMGFVQGTVGAFAFMTGALLGAKVLFSENKSAYFWTMAMAVTLPDVVYVYLAYTMTSNLTVISCCVGIEQFLLGFGIPIYFIYIYECCKGEYLRSRLDICMAAVALSLTCSGVLTGFLQDMLGYRRFFAMVTVLAVLTLLLPVRKGVFLNSSTDEDSE